MKPIKREGTKFVAELPKCFGRPREIIHLERAGIIVVKRNGCGIYIRKDGRAIRVPECVVMIARVLNKQQNAQASSPVHQRFSSGRPVAALQMSRGN